MTASSPPAPALAIIIVNYRTPDLAIRCVETLARERSGGEPFDLYLVDGASGDGSAERFAQHFAQSAFRDWVHVLPLAINGGFGWANNQAMLRLLQRAEPPEYIHLLNPDTVPEPGAITALLEVIRANPKIGAVGSQLLEPDGALAGSAFRFITSGREFARGVGIARIGRLLGIAPGLIELSEPGPAQWVTGASVLFRSAALRQTGLFDDGFFLYFEEVELMHRMARAGWEMWHAPASRIMHIAGAATGVASGGQSGVAPYPAYRYAARRRYLARTGGMGGLVLTNAAWLTGKLLGKLLTPLRRRRDMDIPRELSMTLRYGFWPARQDFEASHPAWDEPPGRPPAWMRARAKN